jgi:hypothetical protein
VHRRHRSQVGQRAVRHDLPPECLRHRADLAHPGNPLGRHRFRLQDVVDALPQHPQVFVQPAAVLAARDRDLHQPVELGGASGWRSLCRAMLSIAWKVPQPPGCQSSGDCAWLASIMISVRSPTRARTDLHDPDIFLHRGAVQSQLDRLPAGGGKLGRHVRPQAFPIRSHSAISKLAAPR